MAWARGAIATLLTAAAGLLILGCGSADSFEGGVRIPARTGEGASWSPDGAWLAIPNRRGVLLRSADGERRRQIAAPPLRGGLSGMDPGRIDWSPDATELRYLTTAGPVKARGDWVVEVAADGSGKARAKQLGTTLYTGTWAPAGWPLVYATGPSGFDVEKGPVGPAAALWALDGSDSAPRPFLDLRGQEEQPVFSSSGESLIFTLSRTERSGFGLWLAAGDGSHPRLLAGGLGGFEASWSPDERWIALATTTSNGDRRRHVYVLPAAGGRLRQLADDEVRDGPPAWTPDGRWITYATYEGEIKQVHLDGGETRSLADLADQEVRNLMWSPDGRHLAYSAEPIVESD